MLINPTTHRFFVPTLSQNANTRRIEYCNASAMHGRLVTTTIRVPLQATITKVLTTPRKMLRCQRTKYFNRSSKFARLVPECWRNFEVQNYEKQTGTMLCNVEYADLSLHSATSPSVHRAPLT